MRLLNLILIFFVLCQFAFAQNKLDRALKKYNSESVPYIHVDALNDTENVVLLDTRKKEEFRVSHLKNAIWVGHEAYIQDSVTVRIPKKDTPIIVYCSIGVRSEEIGEKLLQAGYTNVKNLYGGIFSWKNAGKEIYNTKNQETDSVHVYDKEWGRLLNKGIKVISHPLSVD